VSSIIPAVPSPTGVADVFALQNDGTVAAITAEGTLAWTANLGQQSCQSSSLSLADFQGGLISQCDAHIFKLDGITGQAYPTYTAPNQYSRLAAVHTDGTLFVVSSEIANGGGFTSETATVIGVDPITGAEKFRVATAPGGAARSYGSLIAGDGYFYFPYAGRENCGDNCELNHLKVLRVDSAGASAIISVIDWQSNIFNLMPGEVGMISNADTGVLLSVKTDLDSLFI